MGPAAVALLAVVRTCSAERDAFAEDAEATDAALRVVAAGGAGAVDAADAIRIACARATTARRLLGVRPNSDVMHGSDERFRRGSGKGPPGERLGSALRLFARRSESRESRGRAAFADLRRATNATPRASAGPSSAVAGYGHEPRHARGWSRDSFEATVASPGWRRRSSTEFRRTRGLPGPFRLRRRRPRAGAADARTSPAEARRAIGEILSSAFAALTDEEMASIVTSEDSPAASAAIASACGDDPEAHAAPSRAVERSSAPPRKPRGRNQRWREGDSSTPGRESYWHSPPSRRRAILRRARARVASSRTSPRRILRIPRARRIFPRLRRRGRF